MKRILALVFAICCLFFTACNDTNSIGVLGGEDGPTSVLIGNENGDTVKKPLRMIKADGKLYYDSGKVSDMTSRCGTLDGELKQVGAEHEIPQNDNECNFDGAEGYQNVTSITKEIPINGEWVIFKQFDDSELDMSVFKYCFYLSGKYPKSENASAIVVLTEDINYDMSDHYKLFSSKFDPDNKKYRTTFRVYGDTDKWGVSLNAKDITNKGLILLIEQFGGSPTGDLQTGLAYSLEVNVNDEWQALTPKVSSTPAWNAAAYKILKNEITEMKIDWQYIYGSLPSGYYRLTKEIMDFRASADYDTEIYELYFTIE